MGWGARRQLSSWPAALAGGLDLEHRPKKPGRLFIDYKGDACLTTSYGNVDLALLMVAPNLEQEGLTRTFSPVWVRAGRGQGVVCGDLRSLT